MILDVAARTLTDGERVIALRPGWVKLLQCLAARSGQTHRDHVCNYIWADDPPDDAANALHCLLDSLRPAMRRAGFSPLIKAQWGGYLTLSQPVTVVTADIDAVIPADMVPLLRAILYRTPGAAADRLLALVGA